MIREGGSGWSPFIFLILCILSIPVNSSHRGTGTAASTLSTSWSVV